MRITVGTRGSKLALVQTEKVREQLEKHHPGLDVATRVIRTRGDRGAKTGVGLFVKELEHALFSGEIDLAVHSVKDMPVDLPVGLMLAAIPARHDPRDALVSKDGSGLDALPPGARVGTSSPRRRALVLHHRPDVQVLDLRGNVDTRLQKLERGDYETIIVAFCALARLGWESRATQILEPDAFLPAAGQGALGIEIRSDDEAIGHIVEALNHPPSQAEVIAERSFLRAMGGGCRFPMAALGRARGETLYLSGLVASPDGKQVVKEIVQGKSTDAEALGKELARLLHTPEEINGE